MEHLMTSEEVAELLHVDPVTIRRLVSKSQLAAYRIGADYRFAPSDLQDYLQRQRLPAQLSDESNGKLNHPLDHFIQLLRKVIQPKQTTPSQLLARLDRFDRFTKRARHVLTLAQEEARHLQHPYIGTEHLLLGLMQETEGMAAKVLTNLGLDLNQLRQVVEEIVGPGEQAVEGEVRLTPRSKKAIEFAADEARSLNHTFIGTEHLLLGLIREKDGIAGRVLENLGIQLEQVRAETIGVVSQTRPKASTALKPIPLEVTDKLEKEVEALFCTQCGITCPTSFRYCFNCGQPLIGADPD
jgi:excisionase family DNA binding protein